MRVEEVAGPLLPASCGADPKPSTRFVAEIDEIPLSAVRPVQRW